MGESAARLWECRRCLWKYVSPAAPCEDALHGLLGIEARPEVHEPGLNAKDAR